MASRHWTFCGLVGAFLDLFLAYLMLCGATAAFFASKFLGLAGLRLPSPSLSIFVHPNGHFLRRVTSVMASLRSNFPFDSLLAEADHPPIPSRSKLVINDNDNDDDDDDWSENLNLRDSGSVSRGRGEMAERSRLNFSETEESFHSTREYLRSPVSSPGDKNEEIKALKRAVEQERRSVSILSIELEKERNAAASATDEAMAMILRLQKEKAEIEMEAKQFQRMVEEKNAYDAEEMKILKEIIFRREMEKHVLQKENDMYRRMLQPKEGILETKDAEDGLDYSSMDGQTESDHDNGGSEWEDRPEKRDQGVADNSSDFSSNSGVRSSMTQVDRQRMILDAEVEFLRERLEFVQKGREKLNLSLDPDDEDYFRLHLLEDITTKLHELRSRPTSRSLEGGENRRCLSALMRRGSQDIPLGIHENQGIKYEALRI